MKQTYTTQRTRYATNDQELPLEEPPDQYEALHDDGTLSNPERIASSKLLVDESYGIKALRWEANAIIRNLMELSAGYEEEEHNGKMYYVKQKDFPAALTFRQVLPLIQHISMTINSTTSLANTFDHTKACAYTNGYGISLQILIWGDYLWDDVSLGTMAMSYRDVQSLVGIQMDRGIKGNESRQSSTQTIQQEGIQQIREEHTVNTRGKSLSRQSGGIA